MSNPILELKSQIDQMLINAFIQGAKYEYERIKSVCEVPLWTNIGVEYKKDFAHKLLQSGILGREENG